MRPPSSRFLFWGTLLSLSTIFRLVAADVQWETPPPAGKPFDFTNNPTYPEGLDMTLRWSGVPAGKTVQIMIWRSVPNPPGLEIGMTEESTWDWTVGMPEDWDLTESNVFHFALYIQPEGSAPIYDSHDFNITRRSVASSSSSSVVLTSSSSAVPSSSSFSTAQSSTTSITSPTSSSPSRPSDSAPASDNNGGASSGNNNGNGNSNGTQAAQEGQGGNGSGVSVGTAAGIAVGCALGVALLALAAFFLYRKYGRSAAGAAAPALPPQEMPAMSGYGYTPVVGAAGLTTPMGAGHGPVEYFKPEAAWPPVPYPPPAEMQAGPMAHEAMSQARYELPPGGMR